MYKILTIRLNIEDKNTKTYLFPENMPEDEILFRYLYETRYSRWMSEQITEKIRNTNEIIKINGVIHDLNEKIKNTQNELWEMEKNLHSTFYDGDLLTEKERKKYINGKHFCYIDELLCENKRDKEKVKKIIIDKCNEIFKKWKGSIYPFMEDNGKINQGIIETIVNVTDSDRQKIISLSENIVASQKEIDDAIKTQKQTFDSMYLVFEEKIKKGGDFLRELVDRFNVEIEDHVEELKQNKKKLYSILPMNELIFPINGDIQVPYSSQLKI